MNIEWDTDCEIENGVIYRYSRVMGSYYAAYEYTPRIGDKLTAQRHPENPHDPNAIGLYLQSGERCGWVSSSIAQWIAKHLDAGMILNTEITDLGDERIYVKFSGKPIDAMYEDIEKYWHG